MKPSLSYMGNSSYLVCHQGLARINRKNFPQHEGNFPHACTRQKGLNKSIITTPQFLILLPIIPKIRLHLNPRSFISLSGRFFLKPPVVIPKLQWRYSRYHKHTVNHWRKGLFELETTIYQGCSDYHCTHRRGCSTGLCR
jgi:hypothetical protein